MLTVIIGAGIIGLHLAHQLREQGYDVIVLEKEPFLADHTSGRNSGVIHSGVFYKPGTFKESICIEGNRLTYEWLNKLGVSFFPCGKWVVPETGQKRQLEPFFERIRQLPIPPPEICSPERVSSQEPNLRKTGAIFVPSTGILDAAGYVKALGNYIENQGVNLIRNCEVFGVNGNVVSTNRGEMEFDLGINCAGLHADRIAYMAGVEGYEIKPCRGDYYILNKNLIKRPVYHLPYEGAQGLGLHLTPTVDHQLLLGPNAFFIDEKEDYQHYSTPEQFNQSISFYLPKIKVANLIAAYSGNRPKLFYQGKQINDFTIIRQGPWVHLLGIESPGLTSAPALAKHILKLI